MKRILFFVASLSILSFYSCGESNNPASVNLDTTSIAADSSLSLDSLRLDTLRLLGDSSKIDTAK